MSDDKTYLPGATSRHLDNMGVANLDARMLVHVLSMISVEVANLRNAGADAERAESLVLDSVEATLMRRIENAGRTVDDTVKVPLLNLPMRDDRPREDEGCDSSERHQCDWTARR